MFQALFEMATPELASAAQAEPLHRFHALFLGAAAGMALLVLLRHPRFRGRPGAAIRALLPARLLAHPSTLTDLKLWLAGMAVNVGLLALLGGLASALALAGGLHAVLPLAETAPDPAPWRAALFTLLFVVVSDFAVFLVHMLHHRVEFLWAFHKVHHSAEVLTPLTLYRKHPVYDALNLALRGLMLGTLQGLLLWAWGGPPDGYTLLGENALVLLFHLLGSNLRHSGVFLRYGRLLEHVFISPAQHQIHHSLAPRHWNRNYGEILAVWDLMFGTLYVPRRREKLRFGIPGPQPHPDLAHAYGVPFLEAARALGLLTAGPAARSGAPAPLRGRLGGEAAS